MSTTQPEALRENYTAADMATAAAQGFRDGVASLSLPAALEDLLRQIAQASDDGDSDTHLSKHFYDRIMSHVQTPAVRPVTPLQCPKCSALWLHWPKEQSGMDHDSLNLRSATSCEYCEPANVDQLQRLERIPATLHAPSAALSLPAAGQEPVATQPTPDVAAKMQSNTWDHFGDILPTLKAISRGDWYWGANSRCKYIEIRLDTRDGGCLIYDRERVRISPEQFAHQGRAMKMEPWPVHSSLSAAPQPAVAAGWQRLITAPADEIVLVAAEFDRPGDWRIKCGYFDKQTTTWRVFGASWEPTHWMPLPPAPFSDKGVAHG